MERRGAGIVASRRAAPDRGAGGAGRRRPARRGWRTRALSQPRQSTAPVVAAALPYRGDMPARLLIPERVTVTSIAPRDLDLDRRVQGAAALRGTSRAPAGGRGGGRRPQASHRPRAGRHPPGPRAALARRSRPPPPTRRPWPRRSATDQDRRAGEGGADPEPGGAQPGHRALAALLAELRRRDPGCHLFAAPAAERRRLRGGHPRDPPPAGRGPGAVPSACRHRGALARSRAGTARPRRPCSARPRISTSTPRWWRRSPTPSRPHCSELRVDTEPHLAATAAVWHLATAVRGRLRPSAPSALALAAALHPTPAVCGTPSGGGRRPDRPPRARVARALRGPGRLGGRSRRRRVGGEPALRPGHPRGLVRIHAGAGIVAEFAARICEVAETEVKFRTMVDALEACAATPGATRASGGRSTTDAALRAAPPIGPRPRAGGGRPRGHGRRVRLPPLPPGYALRRGPRLPRRRSRLRRRGGPGRRGRRGRRAAPVPADPGDHAAAQVDEQPAAP